MIVRFYMTTGQVFDTKPPESSRGASYAVPQVEFAIDEQLAGIVRGPLAGEKRQLRPPACVTVTLIGGGRMILMTAHIVRVQVLEDYRGV